VGDRFDRKYGAIAGNSFTGMAFCRLPICCGRRRCCSPSAGKRAFSARVTPPQDRRSAFGVLPLDIAGGIFRRWAGSRLRRCCGIEEALIFPYRLATL
jgi:hypothetical protein